MDLLQASCKNLSGPHCYIKLSLGIFDVVCLGEEHQNLGMCDTSDKGNDVVNIISTILKDGNTHVYAEMPIVYEHAMSIGAEDLHCPSLPPQGHRGDVLNDLRMCLLSSREKDPALRDLIHFTDVRPCANDAGPFTSAEDSLILQISKILDSGDVDRARSMTHLFFIVPLRMMYDAECIREYCPEFADVVQVFQSDPISLYIRNMWTLQVQDALRKAQTLLNLPNFLTTVVDVYRKAFDGIMEIYTLFRMIQDMKSSQINEFLFYGGSSHSIAIAAMLQRLGFHEDVRILQDINDSCLRTNASCQCQS